MKSKKAIVTIGAPGSGKSSYARQFIEIHSEYVYLERDVLREKICNDENLIPSSYNSKTDNFHTVYYALDKGIRANIEKLVTLEINEQIKFNNNIILSNTNLTPNQRTAQHANLIQNGFTVEYKIFNPHILELIERNYQRINIVNENVVFDMYQKLQHQLQNILGEFENCKLIEDHDTNTYFFDSSKVCIICDIDGTIAHIGNKDGKPNRTHFQMHNVHEDEFDDVVFAMVLGLKRRYDADLVFLTGRSADCFSRTIEWLDENLANFSMSYAMGDYHLYSRANLDYRKDYTVKQELYDTFIKDKYEVLAVFDDRPAVVNLWNDLGLKTIAVADQRNVF